MCNEEVLELLIQESHINYEIEFNINIIIKK